MNHLLGSRASRLLAGCRRSCLAALLLASCASCENAVTVRGTVTVPPEVQRLFSREQPGSVEIFGTKIGGGGASLPYLCDPSDQPLVLPYSIQTFGCAEEQPVEARAFRMEPGRIGDVRCGEKAPVSASGGLLGEELAYGAATIFRGRGGGPCESGSDVADVTIEPVAMR